MSLVTSKAPEDISFFLKFQIGILTPLPAISLCIISFLTPKRILRMSCELGRGRYGLGR